MTSAPFMRNEHALQQLANWYLGAFWLGVAAFYISLIQAGYQPQIALLTCCAAAIACLLLRRARSCQEQTLNRTLAAKVVPLALFLVRVNDMIRTELGSNSSMGLMLVSFHDLDDPEEGELPDTLVSAVRGLVTREAGSPVYQINSKTLAVVGHGESIATRLGHLSEELQGLFRAQRLTSPRLSYARLRVGIAVSERKPQSAAELFTTARAAVDLADLNGRETFVRQT